MMQQAKSSAVIPVLLGYQGSKLIQFKAVIHKVHEKKPSAYVISYCVEKSQKVTERPTQTEKK